MNPLRWNCLPRTHAFLLATVLSLAVPALFAEEPLPDAPLPEEAAAAMPAADGAFAARRYHPLAPQAYIYDKHVEPGQQALPLRWRDKFVLAGWEQVQPSALEMQIASALWEHLIQGNPKTGSDLGGFGEKLWMANVRQDSQAVLSDGLLASVLHQDPRYYTLGHGGFVHRAWYAGTRVLITRGDDGSRQINFSEIGGYAGAQILTRTYYPHRSCGWGDAAKGYVIALAGSGVGNVAHEFRKEIYQRLPILKKTQR